MSDDEEENTQIEATESEELAVSETESATELHAAYEKTVVEESYELARDLLGDREEGEVLISHHHYDSDGYESHTELYVRIR